jgi:glycosyltransferase involved in cell wall biosynthesis
MNPAPPVTSTESGRILGNIFRDAAILHPCGPKYRTRVFFVLSAIDLLQRKKLLTPKMENRILFVTVGVWDFLSCRLPLAQKARQSGLEVHVAAPPEPGVEKIIAQGFVFHPIPLKRKSANPIDEARCFLSLFRLYRKLRPALIHQFLLKPDLYGGLAARLLGCSTVSLVTGFGHLAMSDGLKARVLRTPVRWGLRFAFGSRNAIAIFQNPDDQEQFLKSGIVRPSSARLIPGDGIDPVKFSPRPELAGVPVVVLMARMLWVKGVGEFAEAARTLRKRGIAARFVLAGPVDAGHPSDVGIDRLQAWKAEGIIEWTGWYDDAAAIVSSAAICCLPSYREGLPRVLVEACASARPVVTTDTPGCREIIQHGVNGLLVPVADSDALADAIQTLIGNPALRESLGKRGREIVIARFTLDHVNGEILSIYRELLMQRPGPLRLPETLTTPSHYV